MRHWLGLFSPDVQMRHGTAQAEIPRKVLQITGILKGLMRYHVRAYTEHHWYNGLDFPCKLVANIWRGLCPWCLVLPALRLGSAIRAVIYPVGADKGSFWVRVRVIAEHTEDLVDNSVSSMNSNLIESTALKLSITWFYLYFACLWAFRFVQVLVRSDFNRNKAFSFRSSSPGDEIQKKIIRRKPSYSLPCYELSLLLIYLSIYRAGKRRVPSESRYRQTGSTYHSPEDVQLCKLKRQNFSGN